LRGLTELTANSKPESFRSFQPMILELAGQLIEDIQAQRDLVSADQGRLSIAPAAYASGPLLADLARLFKHRGDAHRVAVAVAPTAVDRSHVSDVRLLRRVLSHLIRNAIEASKPGNKVTLDCTEDGEDLVYSVHNPTAIPADLQPRIFERWFTTKGEGRGVGTYTAKHLTEHYLGGTIRFASTPADGTRFEVRYPLAGLQPPAPPEEADTSTPLQRALIVEGNKVNQMVLQGLLKKSGVAADCVGDGQRALKQIEDDAGYDLIFISCLLPELDGYATTTRIRELEPPRNQTPVIGMKEAFQESDAQQCLDAGMNDTLAKPIEPQALLTTLEKWLPKK
jgi:CheY-like chemotaxis protein